MLVLSNDSANREMITVESSNINKAYNINNYMNL